MNPNSPSHEAVTQRAQQIWRERGRPSGADTEIWLEAERQLAMTSSAENAPSDTRGRGNGNSQAGVSPADPKPAAPAVPPSPAATDAQAEAQKKSARAPKAAGKKAPKPAPPESGKPLWSKPHSS